MTLDGVEAVLVARIQDAVGRAVDVRSGPVTALPLGGMRETIFAHAVRYEEQKSSDPEGNRIGKWPFRKGRVAGFEEVRPGRVVIEVSTIANTHARVQALSRLVSPAVLLVLTTERSFNVAESANRLVSLTFSDFNPGLSLSGTQWTREGEVSYFTGRLVFHLEGSLHVLVTRQDGLQAADKAVSREGAGQRIPRKIRSAAATRKAKEK